MAPIVNHTFVQNIKTLLNVELRPTQYDLRCAESLSEVSLAISIKMPTIRVDEIVIDAKLFKVNNTIAYVSSRGYIIWAETLTDLTKLQLSYASQILRIYREYSRKQ